MTSIALVAAVTIAVPGMPTETAAETLSAPGHDATITLADQRRTRMSLPAPHEGVRDLIRTYFGPNTSEAILIAQCESGFRPLAVGTNRDGTKDHGLFQINDVNRGHFEDVTGASWDARYELELNVRFAAWLFARDGWDAWTCARVLATP